MMKRLFDILVSLIVLVLAIPFLILGVLIVRLFLGTPILFRQMRPGYQGRPFVLYKFRTMSESVDVNGNLLPDAARLSQWGQWLRRTSIDELPQLFNVLKGDISLVGPRPLLMEYLPLYTAEQSRRHEVRPGITGWAQINGRNAVDWDERFRLDLWYVKHQSFWLDLKILALTVRQVFSQQGVHEDGEVTMRKFTGGQKP